MPPYEASESAGLVGPPSVETPPPGWIVGPTGEWVPAPVYVAPPIEAAPLPAYPEPYRPIIAVTPPLPAYQEPYSPIIAVPDLRLPAVREPYAPMPVEEQPLAIGIQGGPPGSNRLQFQQIVEPPVEEQPLQIATASGEIVQLPPRIVIEQQQPTRARRGYRVPPSYTKPRASRTR